MSAYVLRLAAVGEMEFLLPGTVAKFIIKCSLFIPWLNRIFLTITILKIFTEAYSYHVCQPCINAHTKAATFYLPRSHKEHKGARRRKPLVCLLYFVAFPGLHFKSHRGRSS